MRKDWYSKFLKRTVEALVCKSADLEPGDMSTIDI